MLYEMLYKVLNGIDYIFYYQKNYKELRCTDIRDRTLLDGKRKPWFEGAFGNCLIALNEQKSTDKLYLVSKNKIQDIYDAGFYFANNEKRIEILEKFADKIIERE